MTKLKPCPFCGSPADYFSMMAGEVIVCRNDNCFMHHGSFDVFQTKEEARKAWNKRAILKK